MSFKINRVYTRTGDAGETALANGDRVSKSHPRVVAYGDVDELNSMLGLMKESLTPHCAELKPVIEYLQQELFDLGAELATPKKSQAKQMWTVKSSHIEKLEQLCDRYGEELTELSSFILPGGNRVASIAHLVRTVARRAERSVVAMYRELGEVDNPELVKYLNRLSDLMFVIARWSLKKEGNEAPLWVKESERNLPD